MPPSLWRGEMVGPSAQEALGLEWYVQPPALVAEVLAGASNTQMTDAGAGIWASILPGEAPVLLQATA